MTPSETPSASHADATMEPRSRRVALVLYDTVELLDFAGPGEVFQVAGELFPHAGKPAFVVSTVGVTTAPITSQHFVSITPEHGVETCPDPDIVVIPGGDPAPLRASPAFMAWLRRQADRAEIVMSVCTGAFVLGDAGLLDGIACTTWHGRIDALRAAFPETSVRAGVRYVDAGRIVTTAGVSAGIDGALHVVRRVLGATAARRTAQYIEYTWTG